MSHTQSFAGQGAMCCIVFHVDDPAAGVVAHRPAEISPVYGSALQWQHPSIQTEEMEAA